MAYLAVHAAVSGLGPSFRRCENAQGSDPVAEAHRSPRQLASNFLKYAMVSLRPSSSPTAGSQPSLERAILMSGIR